MENKTIVKARIAYSPSIVAIAVVYLAELLLIWIGFDEVYYFYSYGSYSETCWYGKDLEIAIPIIIAAVLIPVIIMLIHRYQSKITALTVTEKGVTGSYNSFLTQASVNTPIEHIDSITKSHGILDSLRGGSTVHVHSNSGAVGFRYVQNADEVISHTMTYIDSLKS